MKDHGLNERELATVLAALRLFQRTDSAHSGPENDIASNGGAIEPLSNAEIDDLCERLNVRPGIDDDQLPAESCVASYLARLRAAGTDEIAFDRVAGVLQCDGFMDAAQVGALAAAYTGNDDAQYPSRDAAVEAIEQEFYRLRGAAERDVKPRAASGRGR